MQRSTKASGEAMKRNSSVAVDRILDAAEVEFSAKGLLAGSVQHIAQCAGYSKQLVYHYFDTKEDLYQALLERISDSHEGALLRVDYDALAPARAVELFITRLFDIQAKNGGRLIIDLAQYESDRVHHSRRSEELIGRISACLDRIITRGKAAGDFAPELETARLLLMINMITNGAASFGALLAGLLSIDFGTHQPVAEMRDLCIQFVLQAMRPAVRPDTETRIQ
jgi:AcrR family transcriptional regulator